MDLHMSTKRVSYTRVTRHKKFCETPAGASTWQKLWRGAGFAGNWLWQAENFSRTRKCYGGWLWWQRLPTKSYGIWGVLPHLLSLSLPTLPLSLSLSLLLSCFPFCSSILTFAFYFCFRSLILSIEYKEKKVCPSGTEPLIPGWLMSAWTTEPRGLVVFSLFSGGSCQEWHTRRHGETVATNVCKSADVLYEPWTQLLCFPLITCRKSLLINKRKLPLFKKMKIHRNMMKIN